MNTYRTQFVAACPVNEQQITYSVEITTPATIPVEKLTEALRGFSRGFHEDFADQLIVLFGGEQTIRATHHGVEITTNRK